MKIIPEHINLFLKRCRPANSAGVFYSLPFQNEFEFLLENLSGDNKDPHHPFIFCPFDIHSDKTVYINPTHRNKEAVDFLQYSDAEDEYWRHSSLAFLESTSQENYEEKFKSYQNAINSGECIKAILSTIIKKQIPHNFNVGEYIFKLREAYPQAFVYLFSSPHSGTWIGATPETLVNWESGIVSTMSLAGTRKINSSVPFGNKEKEEQKIVTEYIDQIFRSKFSNVHFDSTSHLAYGEMEHLITKVETTVDHSFTRQNFLELASELHPTPAVGGYPKHAAVNLIKKTENHPRLYYSGYFGPLSDSAGHLAVNLRCMCLGMDHIYVYAGGGIISDSNVLSEWEETRLKAQALLKFLE